MQAGLHATGLDHALTSCSGCLPAARAGCWPARKTACSLDQHAPLLQVLEAVDVVTQVVEDARPLLLRAIELADQVRPATPGT